MLAQGRAVGTVDRIFSSAARILLREAVTLPNGRKGYPKAPFLKAGRSRMFVLDPEQERTLLDAVAARDGVDRARSDGWPYRALSEVLVESGLRRGEARGLTRPSKHATWSPQQPCWTQHGTHWSIWQPLRDKDRPQR